MKNTKGFTLIELLIVIAIIAILAAVVFVALDPLSRFQDARDARRWSDIDAVVSAVKLDQVDNGGSYHANITALTADQTYMIYDGNDGAAADPSGICGIPAASPTRVVDLQFLSDEGYLANVPVSPNGTGTWDDDLTGYLLIRTTTGAITVSACEAEGGGAISISR